MEEAFLGEIRMVAFDYAPPGWERCSGQKLKAKDHSELFKVLGYFYGGAGDEFYLPDLRGRIPIGVGKGEGLTERKLGERGGTETETLTIHQTPAHSHSLMAGHYFANYVNVLGPGDHVLVRPRTGVYGDSNKLTSMAKGAVSLEGGDKPHTNLQPFFSVNFIISTQGIPPSPEEQDVLGEPFLGEIRLFAGSYVPRGWARCDGQRIPTIQNDALFGLIGLFSEHDFITFTLPDLRGRSPLHFGQGDGLAEKRMRETGGAEAVALDISQIARHTHTLQGTNDSGNSNDPTGRLPARPSPAGSLYGIGGLTGPAMHASALAEAGYRQPHPNRQPGLGMNFILAISGIFPSR